MNLRRAPLVLAFAAFAFVACAEEGPPPAADVLGEMEPGTPKAEVVRALPLGDLHVASPQAAAAGRMQRGYRLERYDLPGTMVEVLWVHREGTEGITDRPREDLNPVIFRDDVLDGWGWAHFDERAEGWMLSRPPGSEPPEGG